MRAKKNPLPALSFDCFYDDSNFHGNGRFKEHPLEPERAEEQYLGRLAGYCAGLADLAPPEDIMKIVKRITKCQSDPRGNSQILLQMHRQLQFKIIEFNNQIESFYKSQETKAKKSRGGAGVIFKNVFEDLKARSFDHKKLPAWFKKNVGKKVRGITIESADEIEVTYTFQKKSKTLKMKSIVASFKNFSE